MRGEEQLPALLGWRGKLQLQPQASNGIEGRALQCWLTLAAFVLAAVSWGLGFAFGEDSSGGARYDSREFHWRAAQLFADQPFLPVLRNYPSATTPLQHLLMAGLPWVHDQFAYRLTSFCLATATLGVFGLAVQRRFAAAWPGACFAALATAAVAMSPGFRSAAFWGDTDALPLLLMSLVSLLLHDPKTGTWRSTFPIPRLLAVAVVSAAAFYTRQLYVFLPVFACWVLLTRARSPVLVLAVFSLLAVPAVMLFWYWGGPTPPRFREPATLAAFVYVGALAFPFTLPFIFAQRTLPYPRWAGRIGLILALLGLIMLFRGFQLTDMGGGVVVKIGLLLGEPGTLVVFVAAVLGWWAIIYAARSGPANAILFVLLVLPLLLAGHFYQRYLDPLAFTVVLLLAAPPLSTGLVNGRSMAAAYLFFLILEVIGATWFTLLGHGRERL